MHDCECVRKLAAQLASMETNFAIADARNERLEEQLQALKEFVAWETEG